MEVENFPHAIQSWRVFSNREDAFSCSFSLEHFGSFKGELFCLRDVLGKGVDVGSTHKKGKARSKQMLPL